jgi:hypothetical protein
VLAELPLAFGSGGRHGAGYATLAEYPLAQVMARIDPAGLLTSEPATEVVLLARLPFLAPIPLRGVTVRARVIGETQLAEGRLEGLIPAAEAAVTLLDTQSDGDPRNDTPLDNFLGAADLDTDGDGQPDAFGVAVRFESVRVELFR